MDSKNLYVAPGLVKDQANASGVSEEDAKKQIIERAFSISATYEGGKGVLYFDKLSRSASHALFQNHLVSEKAKENILNDMELCDNVLLRLRDVVKYTLGCQSRARFLVKLSNFLESLNPGEQELFGDCVSTLKRWGIEGPPK